MASQRVIQVGEQQLPPPGDARQDELRRRTDVLEQEAEERAASLEVETVDRSVLEPEREILDQINALEVTHAQPEYDYCWVHTGQSGFHIKWKLGLGFEVVQGDMPEASELKGIGADTTRRLGDVILMRIRKDRHIALKKREAARRRAREGASASVLNEMGDDLQRRGRGVIVHADDVPQKYMDRMAKRAQARNIAGARFDKQLRTGRVPGVPTPGEERR